MTFLLPSFPTQATLCYLDFAPFDFTCALERISTLLRAKCRFPQVLLNVSLCLIKACTKTTSELLGIVSTLTCWNGDLWF